MTQKIQKKREPKVKPGLDQKGSKGLACGILNAIFFREWLLAKGKDGELRVPKKIQPGTGGKPSRYYLDFVTFRTGSELHFFDGWKDMWKEGTQNMIKNAGTQIFLVDDAFLKSPNCFDEVQMFRALPNPKPKIQIIFGSPNTPMFRLTGGMAAATKELEKNQWFSKAELQKAKISHTANIANNWIPADFRKVLERNPKWCNGRKRSIGRNEL